MEVKSAKELNLILSEASIYTGDFSKLTIQNTDEFIKTLDQYYLGMTKDKVTISAKPKIRNIKNAAKQVKGFETIDEWTVKISGDLLDFNKNYLDISLFEKSETKYASKMGLIDVTDYKDVIVIGYNDENKPEIILVRNCLNKEGLNLSAVAKDDNTFKLDIENVYDKYTENSVEIYPTFGALVSGVGA
ncbi:hypothetical protein [Clostridium sp. Ade.TY]|uniref:hypothetical protein n=1 Tax=Clostridium sp. Ade.TY TaxID=1391647 RepID=UPI0004008382|nr:hypothetical protein [Clostridium sp. Ade.TY]